MKDLLSTTFWFAQPDITLAHADLVLGYISAGVAALGIIFLVVAAFISNPVDQKILKKFGHLGLTVGIIGLFWFALRYENTPIFDSHYWMGIDGLVGLVWLGFIAKYFFFNFWPEKREFSKLQIKNKYLQTK